MFCYFGGKNDKINADCDVARPSPADNSLMFENHDDHHDYRATDYHADDKANANDVDDYDDCDGQIPSPADNRAFPTLVSRFPPHSSP